MAQPSFMDRTSPAVTISLLVSGILLVVYVIVATTTSGVIEAVSIRAHIAEFVLLLCISFLLGIAVTIAGDEEV